VAYPTAGNVLLRNANVPASIRSGSSSSASLERRDILIEGGKVAAIRPAGSPLPNSLATYDMDGGLVLPAFVDMHTHIDKGHIWPRRPNPDGTWMSALLSVQSDREGLWERADVERRMEFALRCAYAHGTAALRTHLDSIPPQHDISWALFEEVRERWIGRIELQAVSIISPDVMLDLAALDAVARRTKAAGGILGGAIFAHPRSKEAMLNVVSKAAELGLDLDIHADETLDPSSASLLHLAEAILETGFAGNVVAGHCCVLTVQDEATQKRTIDKVAEAGIAVVSLPMCNLYLQDRNADGAVTPAHRGVTLVKEMVAAGIPVALASDNTRDPFYAYGDLDCLEVFREGARIIHYDHPQDQAWGWLRSVTSTPATVCGFTYRAGIDTDSPADLLLFRARSWTELLSRPQSDRIVLRGGKPIDTTLPDYRELDDLMEA
jgi:cytosine deaminase